MEACRSVWLEDAAYLRGNWRSLMPQARELRLEIGCGKGVATVKMAHENPSVNLVAIDGLRWSRTFCSSPWSACRRHWCWRWRRPFPWD